jgi:hypothetical protein
MNKIKTTLLAAALCVCGLSTFAQTGTVTITNVASFSAATNIALIPFASYRMDTKDFGYGVAALYRVTDNFWTGLRAQTINGMSTTAGVQAQLQVSGTFGGITYTPFLEASTGAGSSSLYASAGPGILINIHQWKIGSGHTLAVGLVGDYEHVVYGEKNWNQFNAGPLLRLSF